MTTADDQPPLSCAHCGRKIYYSTGNDSWAWAEGWCHVESNLQHCDPHSSHDSAAPALNEPCDEPPEADCAALVAAVRSELVNLWANLEDAVRLAVDGSWSGGCENLKDRIKAFSDLVGPASWEDISIPFLLSDTYQRVCADIGHPCTATAGEMAEVRARWEAEVASWAR